MNLRRIRSAAAGRTTLLVCSLALATLIPLSGAGARAIKKPAFEPGLETVELFDAIDGKQIEATVIAKNAYHANLFLTNSTDRALSVKMPHAVVAVHVLKQFFPQGAGNGFPGGSLTGNGAGNSSSSGQGQAVGGGTQGGSTGLGNGQGFFSIPSGKVVQVPLKTLCLDHGKPDPRAQMSYRLVKLEDYTSDETLRELLKVYGTEEVDQQTGQAAAWHVANKLSWDNLAAKASGRKFALDRSAYFTSRQIKDAQALVKKAADRARGAQSQPVPPVKL